MALTHVNVPPENHVKVLDGQGWVGLIDTLGTETTIVNAARVSFGKIRQEMDERDVALLHYLIENRHTSPLEHIASRAAPTAESMVFCTSAAALQGGW